MCSEHLKLSRSELYCCSPPNLLYLPRKLGPLFFVMVQNSLLKLQITLISLDYVWSRMVLFFKISLKYSFYWVSLCLHSDDLCQLSDFIWFCTISVCHSAPALGCVRHPPCSNQNVLLCPQSDYTKKHKGLTEAQFFPKELKFVKKVWVGYIYMNTFWRQGNSSK